MVNEILKVKSKIRTFFENPSHQSTIEIIALMTFIFIILSYSYEISFKLVLLSISVYFIYHEILDDIKTLLILRCKK